MSSTITVSGAVRPRLRHALFHFRRKSVREQADFVLFIAGLGVEYFLLFALLKHHADHVIPFANYIVMGALGFALLIHQFLIFRNSTLQYRLAGSRLDFWELVICLFFGVLTGELGYLLVLAICSVPNWLVDAPFGLGSLFASALVFGLAVAYAIYTKREPGQRLVSTRRLLCVAVALGTIAVVAQPIGHDVFAIHVSRSELDWFFADQPLDLTTIKAHDVASTAIQWFAHGLGRALKAVFAFGAMALSLLILGWDVMVRKTFASSAVTATTEPDHGVQQRSYQKTMKAFFYMDGLAVFTWAMVLGVVVLPTDEQAKCFHLLLLVSLSYAGVAKNRLRRARETVEALSSDEIAAATVL